MCDYIREVANLPSNTVTRFSSTSAVLDLWKIETLGQKRVRARVHTFVCALRPKIQLCLHNTYLLSLQKGHAGSQTHAEKGGRSKIGGRGPKRQRPLHAGRHKTRPEARKWHCDSSGVWVEPPRRRSLRHTTGARRRDRCVFSRTRCVPRTISSGKYHLTATLSLTGR